MSFNRIPRSLCMLLSCLLIVGSISSALSGYSALSCNNNHVHLLSTELVPQHNHHHHDHGHSGCSHHEPVCDHTHDNEITFTDQKLLKQQQAAQQSFSVACCGCLPWAQPSIIKQSQTLAACYHQRAPPLQPQQLLHKQHIELLI